LISIATRRRREYYRILVNIKADDEKSPDPLKPQKI
jgi:hypothetical protein